MIKALTRWLLLLLLTGLLLQLFFVGRIALMRWINPESSAFERSQAWQILSEKPRLRWHQQWTNYQNISDHLKRAVIASEDDGFVNHDGVDWNAIEQAWQKNIAAEQRAANTTSKRSRNTVNVKPAQNVKLVGGSTITQQLAKNLFLSGERSFLRKGQELLLTLLLEAILDKRRILEIYLNSAEWGEGVFGAEAAAQRYYRKPAAQLSELEAARLAVMLPRPRYFEKLPNSSYVSGRAKLILQRMENTQLP